MDKSTHFFGNSVFGQLISLLDDNSISSNSRKHQSDRYIKRFSAKDHLISMLFCSFARCCSLREVSGAMLGLSGKTKHFKLENLPYRSTLSDANKRRSPNFFCDIYNDLLKKYAHFISDSRIKQVINKQIKICDSTTITLFKDILKSAGRIPSNGRQKGGIKMHTVINVDEKLPKVVWFSASSANDNVLLKKLPLDKNIIYVFDKGYNNYTVFKEFSDTKTGFVTRIRENAVYKLEEKLCIDEAVHSGVLSDQIIEIQVNEAKQTSKLRLRKVTFYDRTLKRKFEFLTNLFDMRPDMIAALYKLRWQIELLFKQLKQNFPLKYFLGDNENAIKIQIYCVLIVNLLLTVIQKMVKRTWAFSNLVSFCRIHLFNYIHLLKFLENPEKDWRKSQIKIEQFHLF
jgi:hypothetical protein